MMTFSESPIDDATFEDETHSSVHALSLRMPEINIDAFEGLWSLYHTLDIDRISYDGLRDWRPHHGEQAAAFGTRVHQEIERLMTVTGRVPLGDSHFGVVDIECRGGAFHNMELLPDVMIMGSIMGGDLIHEYNVDFKNLDYAGTENRQLAFYQECMRQMRPFVKELDKPSAKPYRKRIGDRDCTGDCCMPGLNGNCVGCAEGQ